VTETADVALRLPPAACARAVQVVLELGNEALSCQRVVSLLLAVVVVFPPPPRRTVLPGQVAVEVAVVP
jgi:hypothetical protein